MPDRSILRLLLLAALVVALATGGCRNDRDSVPDSGGTRASGGARPAPPISGLVAYSALVSPEEYTYDGGRFDLFLERIPSGQIERLTDHQAARGGKLGGAVRDPVFSPDGKYVLFLSDYADSPSDVRQTTTGAAPNQDAFLNIWAFELKTRSVTPITNAEFGCCLVRCSPDGRKVCAVQHTALRSFDGAYPPDEIRVWDVPGGRGRTLATLSEGVGNIFWSRDGSRVYYEIWDSGDLYSVAIAGGKARLVLQGREGRFSYSFSPDWSRVAYVDVDRVIVAQASGARPETVIRLDRHEHSPDWPMPRWSPDGRMLAVYESVHAEQGHVTKLHVYSFPDKADRIIADWPHPLTDLTWSKDGCWLIATIMRAGESDAPDPTTGWHTWRRDGLTAVRATGGRTYTLAAPDKETKGIAWLETR